MTKEGIEWFKEAGKRLKKYARPSNPIETQVEVWIQLYTSRDQDVDNIIKPTLDLFGGWCLSCDTKFSSRKGCKCGKMVSLLANDKQVYKLDVEKHKCSKEDEHIVVEILGY